MIKFDNNITIIKNLIIEADNLNIDAKSSDIASYEYFLDYFKQIDNIKKSDIIIGAHFTYGWMPTILGRYPNNSINFIKYLDESVTILNKIKNDKNKYSLTIDDLTILKKCINNSIVGASKLLHFINPYNYAIWDSRVNRYLTRMGSLVKDTPNGYLDYLNIVAELTSQKQYNLIHNKLQSQVNYQMTQFRTIELAMYLLGNK